MTGDVDLDGRFGHDAAVLALVGDDAERLERERRLVGAEPLLQHDRE